MAFGDDEEILQDFLVEAGEIIELLSEQLVELEQRPDDKDLLNAIFRGFHTVKGGAGFLQLNAMVDCCHVTENLFDILRNGDRDVDAELMDTVLQALDAVTQQFQQIQSGEEPSPADPQLISDLEKLVAGESLGRGSADAVASEEAPAADESSETHAAQPSASGQSAAEGGFDISDEEFEGFLDAIDDNAPNAAQASAPVAEASSSSSDTDEITEDEFEALLDQLHGAGKAPSPADGTESTHEAAATPTQSAAESKKSDSDEISDGEFEDLLDQLHGAGKAPSKKTVSSDSPPKSGNEDLISDAEFEDLLDQLHGNGGGRTANE